jgi:hypothetical protein
MPASRGSDTDRRVTSCHVACLHHGEHAWTSYSHRVVHGM